MVKRRVIGLRLMGGTFYELRLSINNTQYYIKFHSYKRIRKEKYLIKNLTSLINKFCYFCEVPPFNYCHPLEISESEYRSILRSLYLKLGGSSGKFSMDIILELKDLFK